MPCVIGKDGKTSTGTFRLCRKDYAYGGVRIYFTWNEQKQWGNSFHRRVDGHTRGAYSHGCVRLSDADLSYINNTCPMGTTVVSYNSTRIRQVLAVIAQRNKQEGKE